MNVIQILILRKLLSKPAPDRIPRSGEDAESVDCNVVYFRGKDKTWTLLCEAVNAKGVTGLYWQNNEDLGRVSIPFSLMNEVDLDITHFYGRYDLRYSSIAHFFWEGMIPVDKAKVLFGEGQQFLFNKKELIRSERMEVLKILLEKELDHRDYEVSTVQLSTLLYTEKWVFHPDKNRQLRYNDLLLKSLCDSGDLVRSQYGFKLSAKCLVTLSQFEEDQKRHRENISQARSIKWLTLGLIFVGLVQAMVAYIGLSSAP